MFKSSAFLLFSYLSISPSFGQIPIEKIKTEVDWFINKVKAESIFEGKHNVYVVKVFDSQSSFTTGIIQDSLSLELVGKSHYFFRLRDELVLIQCSNNLSCYDGDLSVSPLVDLKLVIEKINLDGVVFGTSSGYVCTYAGDTITKTYFDDSDLIPSDKSIYNYQPSGTLIELDSAEFKRMIKDKNR